MAPPNIDTMVCPRCKTDDITEHPTQPGVLHQCANGHTLVELKRKNRLGWEEIYYVEAQRRSVKVHGASRSLHDVGDRRIDTEEGE